MDPIATRSAIAHHPVPTNDQRTRHSILKRSQSTPHAGGSDDLGSEWGTLPFGQSTKTLEENDGVPPLARPVHANSERRQSSATSNDESEHPRSTRIRTKPDTNNVAYDSHVRIGHRDVPNPPYRANTQRSWSRGRTRCRSPAPDIPPSRTQTEPLVSSGRIINKANSSRKIRAERSPSHLAPVEEQLLGRLTLSGVLNISPDSRNSRRLGKGAFLVKENPELDDFKFPVQDTLLKPVWRPGDGFSGDEARPSFLFYMTGKQKRRFPRSIPGMKSLSVRDESPFSQTSNTSTQRKRQSIGSYFDFQQVKRPRPSNVKEVWPTYADFADSTLPAKPQEQVPEINKGSVPIRYQRPGVSQAKAEHKASTAISDEVPLKKGLVDFRSLGRYMAPEVRGAITPALLQMRALRSSSPLEESSSDQLAELEEYSEASSIPGSGPDEETNMSNEGDSSDIDSDASMWDEDGNHLYPDDIRQLKTDKTRAQEQEDGDGRDDDERERSGDFGPTEEDGDADDDDDGERE